MGEPQGKRPVKKKGELSIVPESRAGRLSFSTIGGRVLQVDRCRHLAGEIESILRMHHNPFSS